MALTRRQIEDIADDAVNLQAALVSRGTGLVSIETASAWVAAAMDAIVINVTDEDPPVAMDLEADPAVDSTEQET
jgi:hypothetical protein